MPAGGTLFGAAGVEVALPRVITAFAADLIMLAMIALGFIHAMIMEMGEPRSR